MRSIGALLLFAALVCVASCQWAGDTKAVKVSFAAIRTQVDDVNTRLTNAIQNNEPDRVQALDKELNTALDTAMNQASAMNLMDREHLSIAVATARRCLTDMDRYAASGDVELLRAQAQQLQPTVTEIQELLDRAERTTKAT
ncbi:MAG TPA: hypothetical protein VFD83_05105 [Candidatus Polarisedimenticolia bacterium]|nr:hypothetical protein [Candidatus Polarisedimenticolia bacterium]